ncbi:MAG: NAD(P)-dependent oxidoreductase [Proteobacteria bacterium]|nr:NAD(P)-dependent oxidoreductase [Pseudomonadota bacterium]
MPLAGTDVGFIGLGLMGRPMSLNLLAAGARVIVHSRSPDPVQELAEAGAVPVSSPASVAAKADTVITMLPDTPAVETVLLGTGGVVEGLKPGSLVIDMGTTGVMATRDFAAAIEKAGGAYVDAPVSGGTIGAGDGTLVIMAGGSGEAVARARAIFGVLGSRATHVGAVGTGQVAKAANQVIVGLNIGAVAEALTLAAKAGADPAKVREALRGGFADSRILEVHGQRMVDGDFRPGGKVTTQFKDLTQALELAAELGFSLPATALNRDLYARLIEAGHGDLDHSALIKAIAED